MVGVVGVGLQKGLVAVDLLAQPLAGEVAADELSTGAGAGQNLDDEVSHLVARLGAVADPLGWVVGVALVGTRVVVGVAHVQRSAPGQGNRFGVAVVVLPVEVPVVDTYAPYPVPVGQ